MSQTETSTNGMQPQTAKDRILEVLKDNDELLSDALTGRKGYCIDVIEEVRQRWGESAVPGSGTAYVAAIKSTHLEELEAFAEDDEEEQESVAELSVPDIEEFDATDSVSRCRAIIRSDEDFLRQAATDSLDFDEVKDAVRDEYGRMFTPTEDTIRTAVAELRMDDVLPEIGDGIEESDEPQRIYYICELCGYENRSYKRVRQHITNTDDAAHHDRTGKETHLISTRGEPIEDTHEVFSSEDFKNQFDDGFDILWAIYSNPDARQEDIADMLGISQTWLCRRLDSLGLDWEEREQQVSELINSWISSQMVEKELGNATYSGPSTGVNTTSGKATQTIADRPAVEDQISITLSRRQAKQFLCNEDETTVRRRILAALLDDDE